MATTAIDAAMIAQASGFQQLHSLGGTMAGDPMMYGNLYGGYTPPSLTVTFGDLTEMARGLKAEIKEEANLLGADMADLARSVDSIEGSTQRHDARLDYLSHRLDKLIEIVEGQEKDMKTMRGSMEAMDLQLSIQFTKVESLETALRMSAKKE